MAKLSLAMIPLAVISLALVPLPALAHTARGETFAGFTRLRSAQRESQSGETQVAPSRFRRGCAPASGRRQRAGRRGKAPAASRPANSPFQACSACSWVRTRRVIVLPSFDSTRMTQPVPGSRSRTIQRFSAFSATPLVQEIALTFWVSKFDSASMPCAAKKT